MAELDTWKIGTRAIVLANALGLNRATLRATLAALIDANLVIPNPGYGHPLRPEYVLTPSGKRVAPLCSRFERLISELEVGSVAHRKWTAPILFALRSAQSRFNQIQKMLTGISPRALTTALRALTEVALVNRAVDEGYPPTTTYELSSTGQRLADVIGGIADAYIGD